MKGNVEMGWIWISVIILIITGCSTTKNIPAKDALYLGPKITIKGNDLKKRTKKELKSEVNTLARPRTNSRFLGIPFKLMIWNLAGNPKKKNSPAAWIKKMGEAPVLLSDLNLERNVKVFQSHLENQGYFRTQVTGDTMVKNKKAKANFDITPGPLYIIKEVIFQEDSSRVQQAIIASKKFSLLKAGKPFDLEVIKAERIRIDGYLKQKGFYFFNPDYLIIDVDSTIGDTRINIYVNIKKETPVVAKRVYHINEVNVYSNYSLSTTTTDTSTKNSVLYRGYRVFDSAGLYKPKLFEQAMQFYPGDMYNRREHNLTLNRLINLNIFKFVKNRFEVTGSDTMLNAYYYLTPLPKKALRTEIGGNTKSNNITGSNLTLGFTNRNTFRGGEILSVSATAGFEIQYSGQFKGYNTFRLGGEANLAIPRFLVPFVRINPRGGFVPRTNIQLGYEVLMKEKLYTLNSFKGQFGYIWKENIRKEHTFYPISIQYVKPVDVTQEYIDSVINNPTLKHSIDTQFILGANYNYNFNGVLGKLPADGFYFNGLLDLSGNIAGLFKGNNSADSKNLFGVPFSQYLKTEADFRYYKALSRNNVLANRIILGLGFPYGNSNELPFIKQFFIGGNNSLRGFRSRSVGPGTYLPDGYGTPGFVAEQSGDIKLELNSELRFKVAGPVYGAFFLEGGNIWLFNDNPLKPGSKFSNKFLRELAVGTGLGIRVDVNILVLRLDVGIPLKKPFLPENERWVIDDIKLHSSEWRKENLIFNLAIGYPF